MRDIEKRALETQEYLKEKENKEKKDYIEWDEEYRQSFWNKKIWTMLHSHMVSIKFPIKFSDYTKKFDDIDNNFERFIPWIIRMLKEEWGTGKIEDIFILDEQAKKAIEIQSNISNSSNQVENTISTKTKEIEWINLSNKELSEKVWDLFYDSLSSFISFLWENIDNSEISQLLEEASWYIMNAWNICLPYISHDFPEMKHTSEIKWIDIDKQELAKRIWNLEIDILSDFLEKLWAKIEKDWEADKWRWRIKLAKELENCANKLKEASKILIK